MRFKEIETKYNADSISLSDFSEFCLGLKGEHKYLEAAGFDTFYDRSDDEDGFYRIRIGHDLRQLTYKHKTKETNNYVRDEHNLNFADNMSKDYIEGYVESLGYSFNRKIFKNCFIYSFDSYTMVYYVCYDADMHELGRFIEIEMSEEYPWPSEKSAWDDLVAMERICKPLGISPQARVKRSLFELYRK